jgi:lactobin A/cerein 7B family class IIb bacteriocin
MKKLNSNELINVEGGWGALNFTGINGVVAGGMISGSATSVAAIGDCGARMQSLQSSFVSPCFVSAENLTIVETY